MGYRLRLALFIGLIVGPAGVLTFLSLRAAVDEQQSALADLRVRMPAVEAALRTQLQRVVEQALVDTVSPGQHAPEVEFVFGLDSSGAFVRPPILRPVLLDRSAGFAEALQQAEGLEFLAADPAAALPAYLAALDRADGPAEASEALGALQRCHLALKDTAEATLLHTRLRADYPGVLDADGAHALTHSYLRLARWRLPSPGTSGDPDSAAIAAGLTIIGAWATDVLVGELPLHPGTAVAAEAMRAMARRYDWARDIDGLLADLDTVQERADFLAAYDRLLETAVVRADATYLSGLGAGERSWFVVLRPRAGEIVGVLLDLDELAEATLRTPAGAQMRTAGFGLTLFDTEFTAEFERRFARAVRLVAPIDAWGYRLHMGLYSRDEPFVFSHYRNRNALAVAGIALLAGTIGLGAWVLARETAREAQTASLQSEFVANVSHELRTPLTSIRLYAETLLLGRHKSDEQRRQYLQTIMRESQRLSRMVANILEISRMESGRRSWSMESVDVAAVINASVDEFQPILQEQGFLLHVTIDENVAAVHADPEALETAVVNLLGNAIRYSPDRREIDVCLKEADGQVTLEVADRGIGVPTSEVSKVFTKYERASNAAAVATGTGLGLALVAGIAASHGGSVTCHPRDGGGSVFALTLPAARS